MDPSSTISSGTRDAAGRPAAPCWLLGAAIAMGGAWGGAHAQLADAEEALPHHLLVKLAPGVAWERDRDGAKRWVPAGAERPVRDALAWAVTGAPEPLFRQGVGFDGASQARAAALGLDRWYRVPFANGEDPRIVAAILSGIAPALEVVEIDGIGGLATNDPIWPNQWDMENTGTMGGTAGADIDAPAAWSLAPRQGDGVVVAVLDAGVAPHTDLAGRILPGWNVPLQTTNTSDVCGYHGTHVCGTIAAQGDNGAAMAGIAWRALILPVVVVNPCTGSESWVAEGITWAVDHGAEVINMSLQYSVGSQALHDAVLYAAGQGVPMIAATGNSALSQPAFPARWPETIAVTATDQWDEVWALSNIGAEVDIAAPGVNVESLYGTAGTSIRSGTSMAAPHVSGAVALIRAQVPSLPEPLIRAALVGTAKDIEAPGFDIYAGSGRLNAGAALAAAIALGPGPGDVDGDGQVDGADLAAVLASWGPCACPCMADTNGDCDVDGQDLAAVLGGWSSD